MRNDPLIHILMTACLQHVADLGVGEPGVAMNDALVKRIARDTASLGDTHLTDHRQAVYAGHQRTQAVRQHLRQHRDDALGEVHGVATGLGFLIQGRARSHIVTDIGNRHPQRPAAAQLFLAIDGIVKVSRVLAVDGDKGKIAQINALLLVRFGGSLVHGSRFTQHVLRPLMWNAVSADGNVDLKAGVQMLAQHLGNASLGTQLASGVMGDLSHYDLAVLGFVLFLRRNENIVVNARVIGDHRANSALFVVAAYDLCNAALEHLDDFALTATAIVDTRNACERLVTIKDMSHLSRAEVQVVRSIQRRQKSIAVSVSDDATMNEIKLVYRSVGSPTIHQQLAIPFHCAQAATDGIDLLCTLYLQALTNLVLVQWMIRIPQHLENQFSAGNGVFIAVGFAGSVGIYRTV